MGYAFATHSGDKLTKVYAVQEFVNDWGEFEQLPTTVNAQDELTLQGAVRKGPNLLNLGLGWETPPGSREASQVGEMDLHYSQPRVQILYDSPYVTEMSKGFGILAPNMPQSIAGKLKVGADGSITLTFKAPSTDKPIDLYVTAWAAIDRRGHGKDILDGFEDTDPSVNSFEASDGNKWEPFRVMTQVVRVNPLPVKR
jgi:hypothetical protein